MFDLTGGSFYAIQVLTSEGAAAFNYFFTVVFIIGMLGFGVGLLVRMITRS